MSARVSRATAALTALVVAASLLSACIPAPSTPEELDVSEAFATNGIAVITDATDDWPAEALMASPASAVEVMQSEIDSGGGMPGADLDELVPMPPQAPPFSFVVAAWLAEPTTSRAETARAWFPDQVDWSGASTVWYPRAALLLFVADVMEASLADFGSAEPTPRSLGAGIVTAAESRAALALPQAPCTAVSDFFGRTINAIFTAIQLPPDFLASGGLLGQVSGFLAGLFNAAVKLAQQAALAVIASLTAPALRAIGSAVAIVGVASHVSSYLLGVSMTLVSSEDPVRLRGEAGSWFGLIDSNRPLEAQLNDCLAVLGQQPLPAIVEAGAPITWRGYIPVKANGKSYYWDDVLIYPQPQTTVADSAARVVIPWTSNTEKPSSKPIELGTVRVQAQLPKGDVTRLLRTVRTLIDQAITSAAAYGGPFAPQVAALIRAAITATLMPVLDRLEVEILGAGRSLLMIVGAGRTSFEYREPDDPTPAPGTPTPNCFVGQWRFQSVESRWLDLSRSSFQRFGLDIDASGGYSLRVGGWAVYRSDLGGFWTTYDGSTRFTVAPGTNGSWSVTSSRLTASESYAALYVSLGNGYVLGGDEETGALPQREVLEKMLPPGVVEGGLRQPLEEDTAESGPGAFGFAVFGAGLRPIAFTCSPDGSTLTVTGEADATYGSAIWTFRRA